jgi:hypothetical protein
MWEVLAGIYDDLVLTRFRDRHRAHDIVVVAGAGMLSAANLLALEDNGFRFIVGSRTGKIPYELEAHIERHGDYLADGATIETTRRMGAGKKARERRVACHYAFKRARHGNKAINAMAGHAERGRLRRTPAEEGSLRHLRQRELGSGRTRQVPGPGSSAPSPTSAQL